jgi:NADPH:quinone reductase-like Zn-dependent oxidoreductase
MKSLAYNEFGGTDVLQLIDVSKPTMGDNELLVKVKSVSLNPIEWKFRKGEMKMMSGKKFPQFVGGEFSGVIEQVGKNIVEFKPGDEVFGFINTKKGGAIQDNVVVTPNLITHKPKNISFEQAASISVVGIAAMTGLYKTAKIKRGQSILINGCTGNMAIWANQIAKQEGLRVVGACSAESQAFALQLGCDEVIDYRKQNVLSLSEKFDIVWDMANVLRFGDVKRILKNNGIFLNPTPTLPQIIGSLFGNLVSSKKHKVVLGAPNKEYLNRLADFAKQPNFQIPINKIFSFSDYKQAYDYAEKGGIVGKVVINVS